jgi:hypothetical protein
MKRPSTPLHRFRDEQAQGHSTRGPLYAQLEHLLGKPVVLFYTSFVFPVMIDDGDAEMLEGVLQNIDTSKGFALLINSPGGFGLAAERIINLCRSYSKTGRYDAIVPARAKSAATMVCFGADSIHMTPKSELGPVDPQISMVENGVTKRFSVCNLVNSYKDLFQRAVEAKGNLEPFIQQLNRYDEREVRDFEDAIQLARDISIRALHSGMLSHVAADEIAKRIEVFLTPEQKKSHGRAIYAPEAKDCGLKVADIHLKSDIWRLVYEIHLRASNFVNTNAAKCVETVVDSFSIGVTHKQ